MVDGVCSAIIMRQLGANRALVRRICPGRHMAEAILWISMATLLTVFEISLPVDQNGAKIYPDLEFESSIAVR
jgi:hypothetical protein